MAAALLAVVSASCGERPAPTVAPKTGQTAAPSQVPPPPASVLPSRAAIRPAPGATQTVPTAVSLSPTPVPIPLPTPHPHNSPWAQERLDAIVALYRPTPAGEALLRSLDLRHMRAEPGFFGSYGFGLWAGVGEAKPIGVMHELGHSYWGGFPVIGRPELGWEKEDGAEIAPALASYHQDILAFMAQPPDDYEFLRQRLRRLPEVSGENPEPLFHSLEADLPYTTGGDLGLVPPVLRRYWGHFLGEGPFETWERAVGWFQSLSHEERAIAGKYLGFEHLDLRQYPDLAQYPPPTGLLATSARVLEVEERQRLTDLAEQFDLLLGDAQSEEDFRFWRGYLQDKVALYRSHPGHLESLDLARANDLADGLKFLSSLSGSPESRASILADRISVQPFLVNFLPAVDNQTLVRLFAASPRFPPAATLQATASFVERLQRFGAVVDDIAMAGGESPEAGARVLEEFLADTGLEQEHDLKLFFDLFRDNDPPLARRIMSAVNPATVRALMAPVPVQLRSIFEPEGLLGKLDVTTDAEADLILGITLLIEEPSGNYLIDGPFLERLYAVMAERARTAPIETLLVMAETPFPLERMIISQPSAASAALSSDRGLAVELVKDSDAVLAPPARIIYRLIASDPDLAAELVAALDSAGEDRLVAESLAYFAYDKARSEKFPELPISVSQDGAFLESLLERQGPGWLQSRLTGAVEIYRQRVATGEVAPDFLNRYRETLEAAAGTLGASDGERLMAVIRPAFNPV